MTEVTEKVVDAAADVAAEVAHQAEGAEHTIRSLNRTKLSYAALGMAIGAAIGSAVTFVVATRRAEAKYSQITAEEISEMREHYFAKTVAQENTSEKQDLAELVRDQGYSVKPPMAVTPPAAVVERAEEAKDDEPEPEPAAEEPREPITRNVFRDAQVNDEWDWHKERTKRSPLAPYVIHREERDEQDAYDSVTYTYFEIDDVLCNERDEVFDAQERERIVGEANLEKFGHGSGDASVVYIRNDHLEMDIEVCHSPNSYVEEVHGLEPEIRHSYRREREAFDDEEG